jgi:uncharacterized repeat protein (TIGR04076 family)
MPSVPPRVKITVLKRTLNPELIEEYLDDAYPDHTGLCEAFQEGEEFIADAWSVPEEFCARCAWAWADIRRDILAVASGASMEGVRQPGTVISGCTDWFRPVIFEVKRLPGDRVEE